MKNLLSSLRYVIILIFLNSPLFAQVIVKFKTGVITTKESDEENIKIPISYENTWPDGLDQFVVNIHIKGSASEDYDYTIDAKKLTIFKKDLENPVIYIKIKKDEVFDDNEELIISLEIEGGDNDGVQVDSSNNTFVIKLRDNNEFLDEILKRVNTDIDTSESVGTIKLHSDQPTLYTLRKNDGTSENFKNFGKREISSILEDTSFSKSLQTVRLSEEDTSNQIKEFALTYFQVRVQKVELSVFNGVVSDIKVYADIYEKVSSKNWVKKTSEIFSNLVSTSHEIIDLRSEYPVIKKKRVPISIRHLMYDSRVAETKLYSTGMAKGRFRNDYIKFGDVIWYDANIARNYPPGDDESIVLTPEDGKRTKTLTTRTSLRSYINLNIYSDFLALTKAEKGNGLVQTEASAHIYLNTKNIMDKYSYYLNYVEPYMKFSRFDTGYNTVNPDTTDNNQVTINRNLLNQRSFLNLGIKLNLFRWVTKFNNDLEINTFSQFDWANARGKALTQVNMSDALEYETLRVNMLAFGAELKYRTILYRNFGLSSGWKTLRQKLWNRSEFENKNGSWYHSPEFELFYFPIAKSDDKIFVRFKTLITTFSNERNFVQLQVGYKGQFNFNTK